MPGGRPSLEEAWTVGGSSEEVAAPGVSEGEYPSGVMCGVRFRESSMARADPPASSCLSDIPGQRHEGSRRTALLPELGDICAPPGRLFPFILEEQHGDVSPVLRPLLWGRVEALRLQAQPARPFPASLFNCNVFCLFLSGWVMPFSLPNSNQAHLTVMELLLCTRQRAWYTRISEKPHGDSLFYRETKAQGGKSTYPEPVLKHLPLSPANPALSKRDDAHLWGRNGELSCSELMGTCPC